MSKTIRLILNRHNNLTQQWLIMSAIHWSIWELFTLGKGSYTSWNFNVCSRILSCDFSCVVIKVPYLNTFINTLTDEIMKYDYTPKCFIFMNDFSLYYVTNILDKKYVKLFGSVALHLHNAKELLNQNGWNLL